MMKLSDLLRDLPIDYIPYTGDAMITGVVSDSRLVQPGFLFVALVGDTTDGHRYIPTAVDHGASAVVGMNPDPKLIVPYIQVAERRQALPHLARACYGYP